MSVIVTEKSLTVSIVTFCFTIVSFPASSIADIENSYSPSVNSTGKVNDHSPFFAGKT